MDEVRVAQGGDVQSIAEGVRAYLEATDEMLSSGPVDAVTRSRWHFILAQESDEMFRALVETARPAEIGLRFANLVYSAYEAAISMGIDLDRCLMAVHTSMMTKIDGDGNYERDGITNKILPGPFFVAPDMEW